MGLKREAPASGTLNYVPRKPFIAFHQRTERFACLVCHRRSGKTVASIHELILRALYTKKKNGRYGYVAPFRAQARNIAWQYLKDSSLDFAVEIRESDLSVELPNGAKITLYGSDNIDALRGLYFDGLVIDEYADCRPNLWATVLLPTLADRKGWAVFLGTPKGAMNQFYDFAELSKQSDEWFHLTLKADTSNLLPSSELESLKTQMSEGQYAQEMLCSFKATLVGTYYSALINKIENDGQINNEVVHDPNFPVTVAMDIGYSDSTVMFFYQMRPDGVAFIDCHEGHGKELRHYFDTLKSKPYKYDTIWLPHDARAKTLQTGKSVIDQFIAEFKDTDTSLDIVPHLSVQDGIEAVRVSLPYCWINATTCATAVEALRTYRRKFNELLQRFEEKPLHSWESDFADAFRYSVLVAGPKKLKPPDPLHDLTNGGYAAYSLDQLYAEREKSKGSRLSKMRI